MGRGGGQFEEKRVHARLPPQAPPRPRAQRRHAIIITQRPSTQWALAGGTGSKQCLYIRLTISSIIATVWVLYHKHRAHRGSLPRGQGANSFCISVRPSPALPPLCGYYTTSPTKIVGGGGQKERGGCALARRSPPFYHPRFSRRWLNSSSGKLSLQRLQCSPQSSLANQRAVSAASPSSPWVTGSSPYCPSKIGGCTAP